MNLNIKRNEKGRREEEKKRRREEANERKINRVREMREGNRKIMQLIVINRN